MLPQTPVFFMNANAPKEPNKNKTKNYSVYYSKTKQKSTQYINIIMLNSFQLKLETFTKNEQNKNKKTLQAHQVTTKTGQKKQQYKFQTKTLQAHHVALS